MEFLDILFSIINIIFNFITSPLGFILIVFLIMIYHFILFFVRDGNYIKARKLIKDPEELSFNDLKEKLLVIIVVPAWKEGKEFKDCLVSLTKLTYPNLKVIVNAGGDDETLEIANSFKKYDNFVILHQKGGSERAELGKIRALNDCFNYINEGITYFIDADCYITDELFLRMIYPIINQNEKVVIGGGMRPLKSQEHIDLVRYLEVDRSRFDKYKFTRYNTKGVGGGNTTMDYEVIRKIGKFSEDKFYAEDVSRGQDVMSKGYKIYWLNDYRSFLFTHYTSKIKELLVQKRRYIENRLLYSAQTKNFKGIMRALFLYLLSVYILIFPFFIFIKLGLFFIGIFILISIYFKKVRRYFIFKKVIDKKYYKKFPKRLWIKIFCYIYIEMISNIIIPFHYLRYRKKIKRIVT